MGPSMAGFIEGAADMGGARRVGIRSRSRDPRTAAVRGSRLPSVTKLPPSSLLLPGSRAQNPARALEFALFLPYSSDQSGTEGLARRRIGAGFSTFLDGATGHLLSSRVLRPHRGAFVSKDTAKEPSPPPFRSPRLRWTRRKEGGSCGHSWPCAVALGRKMDEKFQWITSGNHGLEKLPGRGHFISRARRKPAAKGTP